MDFAGLYDKKRGDSINDENTKWPCRGSSHTEGRMCGQFDLMERRAAGEVCRRLGITT